MSVRNYLFTIYSLIVSDFDVIQVKTGMLKSKNILRQDLVAQDCKTKFRLMDEVLATIAAVRASYNTNNGFKYRKALVVLHSLLEKNNSLE